MATKDFSYRANEIFSNTPREGVWATIALLFGVWFLSLFFFQKSSNFPSINYDKSQWTYIQAKFKFHAGARKLISQGFEKFSGPFNIVTEFGPLVMLPPEYIDAVNHEPKLNFNKYTEQDLLAKYDTFRNFRPAPPGLIEEAVMKGLTRSLPKFTKALSDETTSCLQDAWGESTEWHEVDLRDDVLNWVARLSCRIFSGEELTKNKEWLRISKEYTVNSFTAVAICKMVPGPLRWIVERTLPLCRRVRADRRACVKILTPILEERRAEIAAAKREGRQPILPNDSIEWCRDAAKGRLYSDVDIQIGLSIAAIHTTSDLLGQALLNIGAHPEMVQPIRKEAVEVLGKHGWQKTALTELRILDSFLKETQRLKPITMASMHRLAIDDVELPNDVKIRKGERIAISSHRMWSEADYENPDEFDGFRFVKRRKVPGYEHKSQLISTNHDHTAFSHGKHACPGRFFAANEVKIAMVHLVLKYDIKLKDLSDAVWLEKGATMMMNPTAKLSVRRRKEELDLENIQTE